MHAKSIYAGFFNMTHYDVTLLLLYVLFSKTCSSVYICNGVTTYVLCT
jgi:hypothetical protein